MTASATGSGSVAPSASQEPGDGATAEAVAKAVAFILRSTEQRPQTEAEVRTKLERREFGDDVVDAALVRARKIGAIDDAAFARAWVEDRGRERGYGAARLRTELRRRQVAEPLIDAALAVLDDRDDLAVATDLAAHRAAQLPASLEPEAVARRLAGFLVRRGYPPGLAQRAAIVASGLDRVWD